MVDYNDTKKPDDKRLTGDINPDLMRLIMGETPNKPENIDLFTRLNAEQINTITLFRSLRDKAEASLKAIHDLEPSLSVAEVEYLQSRRARLQAQGVDPARAFVGIMSLCNNFERLQVSLQGKGREEWFGMLEPKAHVSQTNLGSFVPQEKKGIFDFMKKKE